MLLREGGAKGWDDIKEKTVNELLETLEKLCTNMDSSNILGNGHSAL